MTTWIVDRLPAKADADLHGLVRWGIRQPGLLIAWTDVRAGEPWKRSAAWTPLNGKLKP